MEILYNLRGESFFTKKSMILEGIQIPSGIKFVNDCELEVPVDRGGEDSCCAQYIGRHWSLYASADMNAEEFEVKLQDVEAQLGRIDKCHEYKDQEQYTLQTHTSDGEEIDRDYMPCDRLTYVSVMALDDLAEHGGDANVCKFADLFALHLRATNMDFEDVLKFRAAAYMVATALNVYTVRDPLAICNAYNAQDLLKVALDLDAPVRPKYKPYWEN
jgi:hypothetical protein